MSVFIPAGEVSHDTVEITNLSFFIPLSSRTFRDQMEVSGAVSNSRVIAELERAVLSVNRDLDTWRQARMRAGYSKISDIPAEKYGERSVLVMRYEQAVFHWAKAGLMEKKKDFDTTGQGETRTDGLENTIEDHLRVVRQSLAAIKGKTTVMAELI